MTVSNRITWLSANGLFLCLHLHSKKNGLNDDPLPLDTEIPSTCQIDSQSYFCGVFCIVVAYFVCKWSRQQFHVGGFSIHRIPSTQEHTLEYKNNAAVTANPCLIITREANPSISKCLVNVGLFVGICSSSSASNSCKDVQLLSAFQSTTCLFLLPLCRTKYYSCLGTFLSKLTAELFDLMCRT